VEKETLTPAGVIAVRVSPQQKYCALVAIVTFVEAKLRRPAVSELEPSPTVKSPTERAIETEWEIAPDRPVTVIVYVPPIVGRQLMFDVEALPREMLVGVSEQVTLLGETDVERPTEPVKPLTGLIPTFALKLRPAPV
jgi:hypothetical protein